MPEKIQHRKVHLNKTHPSLYYAIMTLGVMNVCLALNFFFTTPTFNPYGIPKNYVGCVFALIGASQLFFLNIMRDLRAVRISLAVSISFMCFWGLSNTQQFFNGKSSLQLPILFLAISILQIPLLTEAPVNPTTRHKQ